MIISLIPGFHGFSISTILEILYYIYIYCKWILYDDMTLIPVFHGFSISTILDIYYIANGYDMI